jgi:hypothetical protein
MPRFSLPLAILDGEIPVYSTIPIVAVVIAINGPTWLRAIADLIRAFAEWRGPPTGTGI